jgi:hypothetical protein
MSLEDIVDHGKKFLRKAKPKLYRYFTFRDINETMVRIFLDEQGLGRHSMNNPLIKEYCEFNSFYSYTGVFAKGVRVFSWAYVAGLAASVLTGNSLANEMHAFGALSIGIDRVLNFAGSHYYKSKAREAEFLHQQNVNYKDVKKDFEDWFENTFGKKYPHQERSYTQERTTRFKQNYTGYRESDLRSFHTRKDVCDYFGLRPNATKAAIKKKYYQFAVESHPDKTKFLSSQKQHEQGKKFREATRAWEYIIKKKN